MSTVIETFGLHTVKAYNPEKVFRGAVAPRELIDSRRLVGIEVEVENLRLNQNPPSGIWIQEGDGSLRNNGAEWITRPIEARWAPYALRELLADSLTQDCCFSPRTSTHVHVNCQDLDCSVVTDIVLLYACLEPLLYQYAGRGRIKNIYCVPIMDTSLLAYASSNTLDSETSNWSKYTGLNIVPIREKGTIEFRHMHGTFDHEKLSVWIRLITKLIDYVVAQGTSTIRKLVAGFDKDTDLFGLLIDIFGPTDVRKFTDVSFLAIKEAVENAKIAFLQTKTHLTLIAERNLKASYFAKG
jgi:hypothetical protein